MGGGIFIAYLMIMAIVSIFMYSINSVKRGMDHLQFRSKLKHIRRSNEDNRKVTVLEEPQNVSALLASVPPGGKTITTGDDSCEISTWRNVITTHVIRRARAKGMGAVVLHNGNRDLVARLRAAFGSGLVSMGEDNPRLDLTSNLTPNDIVRFLLDEEDCGSRLPESCFEYLETLLEMYEEALGRMPCFSTLADMARWSREKAGTKLDSWARDGYISDREARRFQMQLDEFADGRHKLNRYLDMLHANLNNVLAPATLSYRGRVAIRPALASGRVLAIDLCKMHDYRQVLGILGRLIEESFPKCRAGLLVMDNIAFGESTRMKRLIIEKPVNLSVHLSMNDMVARCGSNTELLNSLMAGSRSCFVLRHQNGHSCETLSKWFGTYEHEETEMTEHLGSSKGHADVFGSSSTATGYTTKKEFKPRVQAGQIEQLQEGDVFMTKADVNSIIHCPLADG